ncbi:MAG: hypothetical protein JNJ57_11510 [Saprospiraceae bacterium]|nr:hypothetical protein [Saprospiraceae bacterium]
MNHTIFLRLLIFSITVLTGCRKQGDIISDVNLKEVCEVRTDVLPPKGYEVNMIGSIDFNGSAKAFQFVDELTGFAMMNNNVGGYVEVFKTTDGGQTWANLDIGIQQYARGMVFKNENLGIITCHDITGCPPPNCQNRCVMLKTENGGLDWKEIEFSEFKGILYHPQFDSEGNLYANLSFDGHHTIMKSEDEGVHWDTLVVSSALDFTLLSYSFKLFQDKIYASAKDGRILVLGTDGQLIKSIELNASPIWDLEIIDENNLVVVVSGKVLKSTDGGVTWQTILEKSTRMIGFDSVSKGLMLIQKSSCPTDVYQVNDLIAATWDGGGNWSEAEQTTTNLRIGFSNSQKMGAGNWLMMLGNQLFRVREK